jgi:hypothetical protein
MHPLQNLQRAAGNGRIARALGGAPSVQRAPGVQVSVAQPLKWDVPMGEVALESGITLKPKVTFEGKFTATAGSGDTKVKVGMPEIGPSGLSGTKPSVGVEHTAGPVTASADTEKAKVELKRTLADGASLTGGLETSGSGVTPSVQYSAPFGAPGSELKLEFSPWKVDSKAGTMAIAPVQVMVSSQPLKFATEHFTFEGTVSFGGEASIDAAKAAEYLAKKYGPQWAEEVGACVAMEVGLAVALIGGALLIGLDIADEERRSTLSLRTLGKARQVVRAEEVYLTTLEGRNVPAGNEVERLAKAEGEAARVRTAERLRTDPATLAAVAGHLPDLLPFRFRDAVLDDLRRSVHQELDKYAEAHPFRTLWGLRTRDDKRMVTDVIEQVREGGDLPQLRAG